MLRGCFRVGAFGFRVALSLNYCILAGLGCLPEHVMPLIRHRLSSQTKTEELFRNIKQESLRLKTILPTNYDYLRALQSKV